MSTKFGADLAHQVGRFGLAISVIALIATGLFQFSGRSSVMEPSKLVINSPK